MGLHPGQPLLCTAQMLPFCPPSADHQQDTIHVRSQHGGIGHGYQGWGVEEYHVCPLAQQGDDLRQPTRAQKLGGYGGQRAAGKHPQIVHPHLLQGRVGRGSLAQKQGGQPSLIGQVEDLVLHRVAQITVHNDGPYLPLSQRHRQVGHIG